MRAPRLPPAGIRYEQVIVQAVGIGLAATILGLARFGYGILLPPMRADLGWTFAQAGAVEAGGAVGYLVGALACPLLVCRVGDTATLRWCAAITALSLLGCALLDQLPWLVALRAVGGASAAALFVAGALVAARLASTSAHPATVLGIYYAGVGPGIMISALLAPAVLTDPGRWPLGWLTFGIIAVVCAVLAGGAASSVPTPPDSREPQMQRRAPLRWAALAFGLFGIGYIPYVTFAVAYWREASTSTILVTALWTVLAVTATASGLLWRTLLARPARALAVLLTVVTAGVALPLASTTPPVLAASAALFGSAFLTVSAATTALIRDARPHREWPPVLARFTVLFAAGQIVGPVVTGVLADRVGLHGGLGVSVAVLVLAIAAAWRQHAHTETASHTCRKD